ncbi:MAG: acyclic terpene utilization AtuA family protein [Bryobacterales bacterium]|nr:acyclic terpene utilization AtuA family protein [Bryobacterales bacterium]MBV9396519.1 acyclic terpene utilization AtuA family protein [Bryobacterales bacterium]
MIRIANGQGFWGDSLEAPVDQVRRGPIDYLTLDYLAEVTMSILQKQRARDPKAGYARDFVEMIGRVLPDLTRRRVRVIANAGGINPKGCADAVDAVAERLGIPIKIAVVAGDDLLPQLDELLNRGIDLKNMETGAPLSVIRSQVQSANVYFGAFPIVQALRGGADIVITGRVTDTALGLAPTIHEFGWGEDDWDKLAAGTIAGHTIECGAQCTGGNCQYDWETIPDLAGVGYPIVEAEPDGTFVITKHAGTGGRVTVASVKEQLLYEMGDPREYITADCIADFTTIQLDQCGPDRVRFRGIKGRPPTAFYKVSISYIAGFKALGSMVYAWPDAYKKARAAEQILRKRLDHLGLQFEEIRAEFLGANACHGIPAAEPSPDVAPELAEVVLRFGVRGQDRAAVERFTREIPPLALNGPPVVSGLGLGRPHVEDIVAYWPALISKHEVKPEVTLWPSES